MSRVLSSGPAGFSLSRLMGGRTKAAWAAGQSDRREPYLGSVPQAERFRSQQGRGQGAPFPQDMAQALRAAGGQAGAERSALFRPYQPPAGVRGGATQAHDSAFSSSAMQPDWLTRAQADGTAFPGYPVLAELAQRAEYRHMVEVIATESTREWIAFHARGGTDKHARIAELEAEFTRLEVRQALRSMAEYDGYYGMGLLYADTGQSINETPLLLRPETFRKGMLRALRAVEPVWTMADSYSTTNPLSADFYAPTHWWVQGQRVHSTRLLRFVSRQVPDLLNAFSVVALSTDMTAYTQDPEGLLGRVEAFNRFRSNRGTFVLDKEREKLDLLAAPLAGLDRLQAQAQEQMCSVAQEPLVKFAGITPAGLNASAEGEIRVFYDRISAYQENTFRPALITIMHMAMLSLWGETDPDISFSFRSLWQMDARTQADVEKTRTEIDERNIRAGVVTPAEARRRTAHDPSGQYAGISVPQG